MGKIRWITLIIAAIFTITPLMMTKARAADGHQHDTNLGIGDFSLQHRFISEIDYTHLELGAKINKYVGLNLRYATAGNKQEIRPRVTVQFKWKPTDSLGLSYKNYFEYRIRDDREDTFRYRGKLKAAYKFGNFVPYVSDRFNWTEDDKLYAHELEGGVKYKVSKRFSISVFYRQITDEHFNRVADLTGTSISFNF